MLHDVGGYAIREALARVVLPAMFRKFNFPSSQLGIHSIKDELKVTSFGFRVENGKDKILPKILPCLDV